MMLPDARAALQLWDRGNLEKLRLKAGEALSSALRQKRPVPLYYPLLLQGITNEKKEELPC